MYRSIAGHSTHYSFPELLPKLRLRIGLRYDQQCLGVPSVHAESTVQTQEYRKSHPLMGHKGPAKKENGETLTLWHQFDL